MTKQSLKKMIGSLLIIVILYLSVGYLLELRLHAQEDFEKYTTTKTRTRKIGIYVYKHL